MAIQENFQFLVAAAALSSFLVALVHAADHQAPSLWPVIRPGPSWSVPRFSLPSCLGVLPEWQMQWWYFAGHGVDAAGKSYSLFFHVDRVYIPELKDSVSGLYVAFGIPGKTPAEDLFLYAGTVGQG